MRAGAVVRHLTGHAEATMNGAACASVGKALYQFDQKYLTAASEELETKGEAASGVGSQRELKIQKALESYENRVKASPELRSAWESFKTYMQGSMGALDRVTTFVEGGEKTFMISPREVFALVYLATVDDAAYGKEGARNHEARLETLDKALITLHQGANHSDTRCHLGIRNDLVGTLNQVYPGIQLADDASSFLMAQLHEWISGFMSRQEDRQALWHDWLRAGEMPETLQTRIKEQGAPIRTFLQKAMQDAGFENETALTQMMDNLTYLSPPLGNNIQLHTLNHFYVYKEQHPERADLTESVESYLDKHWTCGDEAVSQSVSDFLAVMTAADALDQHGSTLSHWNADQLSQESIDKIRTIQTAHCQGLSGDSLPALSPENRALLDQFHSAYASYCRDQRVGWIENYFVRYFAATPTGNDRPILFSALFDQEVRSKIVYTDLELANLLLEASAEVHLLHV